MKNGKNLIVLVLVTPFLFGATSSEELHSNSEMNFISVTSSNASQITNKYGYFIESKMPTITRGKESNAYLEIYFVRKTTMKLQLRLYYVYGTYAKFKSSSSGSSYYQIFKSPYSSGSVNSLTMFRVSLGPAYEDHGIKTDYRYNIFTATFALGFYVDEHSGSYKGVFYYFYLPTTYNSGNRYRINVNKTLDSSYKLLDTVTNKYEYHRALQYGGKEWKSELTGIGTGKFIDWADFGYESRGEATTDFINVPLKMQVNRYGTSTYTDLPTKNAKLNLFIYEGYDLFSLGETSIGYDGNEGYAIPLKTSFDGRYITFVPKETLYLSPDGRRVYSNATTPSKNKDYLIPVNGKIPLPSLPNKTPRTIKFQIELQGVGLLGLVDITAKFSYTISSSYFGSHKNSNYYVEEEL